jgi:hypothetical protein
MSFPDHEGTKAAARFSNQANQQATVGREERQRKRVSAPRVQLCAAMLSGRDAFVGSLEGEPVQGCWRARRRVVGGRREPDGLGWGSGEARG